MELQIFLFLGILYATFGIAMLAHPSQIKKSMTAVFKDAGHTFIVGFISVIFGAVILTMVHGFSNLYEGIVTVLGVLALIKGIVYIAYPETIKKMALEKFKNEHNIRSIGILCIAIAGLLLWKALWCGCLV